MRHTPLGMCVEPWRCQEEELRFIDQTGFGLLDRVTGMLGMLFPSVMVQVGHSNRRKCGGVAVVR